MNLKFFKPQNEYKPKIFVRDNYLWFSIKTAHRWNIELLKYFRIGQRDNKKDKDIYLVVTESDDELAFEVVRQGNYYKIHCPQLRYDYDLINGEKQYFSIRENVETYQTKILQLTPLN